MRIGEIIKKSRTARNITQEEMAMALQKSLISLPVSEIKLFYYQIKGI